jgi:HD-GYP domain-containing protein (c-di-GMP phosphodiesterase class II)
VFRHGTEPKKHTMPFAELSAVKHRLLIGKPLPFNVRDADQTLLLARGHVVQSQEQLDALFLRGAQVDIVELQTPRDEILQAPRALLPELWSQAMVRLGSALREADAPSFREALTDAADPVQSLVERDPDLAIFQVLRQDAGANIEYGAQRSLQTAITSLLVALRMGWEPVDAERAFKVALTMNLSMLDLQGQLSRQDTVPSLEQRTQLQTHPMRSVRLLETAGIRDEDWLRAVLQHHEFEDGSGYPSGTTTVGQLASLVRRSDIYTSKLASRSGRDAMAADMAGRQMFMQDPGHPMTAALVKEFGIYPPGCHVRLASGELAVVVARGEVITAPIVACLTNARGMPLVEPVRRETTDKAHAVVGVVGERSVTARPPLDRLMAALAD